MRELGPQRDRSTPGFGLSAEKLDVLALVPWGWLPSG